MERIKSTIPNMFTLGNLSCGIISLLMTCEGNYKLASLFVILAALLDRYDGRVARALKVSSDIGKELDSLSDLISFGVAPALLVFMMNNMSDLKILGYATLIIFPVAGAYRLARYNISSFSGVFSGIPITCAGILLSIYCLLNMSTIISVKLTILIVFGLSYLMVSNIQFKKR